MSNAYCQRLQILIQNLQKVLNPGGAAPELALLAMELIEAADFFHQFFRGNLGALVERIPLRGGERVHVLLHSNAECRVLGDGG